MGAVGWTIAGVLIWLAISAVLGLAVARGLRAGDGRRAAHEEPEPGWFVHDCPRCRQRIEYVEPEQLNAVKIIHSAWCEASAPG